MKRRGSWLLLPVLMAHASLGMSADYWAYQYQGFDVLAQGSAAYAQSIARQLHVLDQSFQQLLGREKGAAQPPTRIFALRPTDYAPINASWSEAGGAYFRSGPFDHVLVVPSENEGRNANRAMYAQRARGWLTAQGLARLPDWFKHGFGLLAAAATFDNDQLAVGQEIPAYMTRLSQSRWITMDKILLLPSDDPKFHETPQIAELYDAECWWLAHVTMMDGSQVNGMHNYIALVLQGQTPEVAYSSSFEMDVSALGDYLKKLHRTLKLRQFQIPLRAAPEVADPAPLDDDEVKARLAQLAVSHDAASKAGEQWAREVLVKLPDNERALLALLNRQLAQRQLQPALASVERLNRSPSLSAAGRTELAVTEISLASKRDSGVPGMAEVSANTLRANAREQLRRALELDAEHPMPVYALGWLLSSQGDVASVRELLPVAEQRYYRRPYNAELANLLVRMHALTGNTDSQFKFAVAARRLATEPIEQQRAQRRIDRLRPATKSKVPEAPAQPTPPAMPDKPASTE
jgi:hypothetical protein